MEEERQSMRWAGIAMTAMLLAGCATSSPPPAARPRFVPPPPRYAAAGLDRVIGKDAAQLVQQFGKPDADVIEGTGRKLQFQSAICVLDTYLYAQGSRTPVVTYVDARQPDGRPIDRASCVAAIARRGGGR